MVTYEWDIETVTDEDGDVMDHNHADKLKELLFYKNEKPDMDGCHYELVLVRDLWEDSNLEQRTWAYPDGGKMPKEFDNGVAVPKRFLEEYERVWK